MTYQTDCTLPDELLEQIADQGLDVLPELIRTIINTAMQIERQQFLNASPYERTPERRGHANGYKPKTVTTRVGQVRFDVPQVRDSSFYPQALEKVCAVNGPSDLRWRRCTYKVYPPAALRPSLRNSSVRKLPPFR